jgi:nucleoid DNA-binding protein
MQRNRCFLILSLFGMVICAMLGYAGAQTQTKFIPRDETFVQRVARYADVKEKDAEKCIQVIGRALMEDLRKGRSDNLPGLGSFRVVRVDKSKDLVNGRPATIPAYNVVEFSPEAGIVDDANLEGVEPAVVVPAFEYRILPGQTPGQKMGSSRMPNSRMR